TFGAEEHGLFGSANLADEMDTGGTLPEVMLNFDVTGRGSLVEVIGSQDLREGAIAAGQDLEIEVVSSSLPPNSGSDHQSFAGHGIDVLFFTSGEYAEIHTPGDTIDIIQEDEIERIGLVAQAFLVQELERIARG
ncbi:MAG: M28 family peptidase, partial [Dehalococcoidia bacterium]|nr:M28 family peptidase [Dehalococcoidia bacterium]